MKKARFAVALFTLAVFAAGCAGHQKRGDRAAVAGNWRTAEAEYRMALAKKPNEPGLKEKHAEAKRKAFDQAITRARQCMAEKNLACAQGEAEYAAGLDPNDAEARTLASGAGKANALDHLARARAMAGSNALEAMALLDRGRAMSSDPEVLSAAPGAQEAVVAGALSEIGRMRQQAAAAGPDAMPHFDRAIAVADKLSRVDPRHAGLPAEVRNDKERWIGGEYDRLAGAGDQMLMRREWSGAKAQYLAAEQRRPGGRGKPLVAYCDLVAAGDASAKQRQWRSAESSYRSAAGMNEDKLARTYAAQELERVAVRPVRFSLRSILVKPVRPNGKPWQGRASPQLSSLPAVPTHGSGRGPDYRQRGAAFAARVPVDNRPTLFAEITLPDGRKLRTPEKKDVWVSYDSWFVLDSNKLDDRTVLIQVMHREPDGTVADVGTTSVPLRALLDGAPIPPSASVLDVEIAIDRPGNVVDGAYSAFTVVPGRANEAPDGSSPVSTASVGYRLARVDAGIRTGDWKDEDAKDVAPDLRVEVEQSGRVVYRSPEIKDSADGSWSPEAVYFFAAPGESLTVRLLDADPTESDAAYGGLAAAPTAQNPTTSVTTPAGSFVKLVFEPRVSGP